MNEKRREWTLNYGDQTVTIETGRLAKQADGAVLVSSAGTQVLVTVCSALEMKDGQDFFPLLVEYTEKFYSAGKFLGGFRKREGRPSDREALNARLIDRPLRPLFPEGYMFDTVISCTVLSYSSQGDPEVLAGLGASAALTISDIPFAGPVGTCKVGRIDGKYVLNPAKQEWKKSDMEIALSASKDAILMVEGEADIVPEKEVLEAIWFGHDHIKEYVALLETVQKEVGKTKREFVSAVPNEKMLDKITADYMEQGRKVLGASDKMERMKGQGMLRETLIQAMKENPNDFGLNEDSDFKKEAGKGMDELLYNILREDILDKEKRIGNRGLTEVRSIETETDPLRIPHGSALFTRGETQVLATVTLGGSDGEQMFDTISETGREKFYLHYNFPPYSVGEARGVRGVGRREIGHGNLAERGIKAVIPKEDFPYTTRVVCEVLESNGSSSMGSVCAASMALMDAGVPIVKPVAGIAMGLVSDEDRFKILTDILGDEDHLGDMDFKVAGTEDGLSAIQMDIKITGLTREIVEQAMAQAREGRLHILNEMSKTISTQREHLKETVPKIEVLKIPTDKIGVLIGPGGKNIRSLQEKFQATIETDEDGTIKVIGTDLEKLQECLYLINLQINGPIVGNEYDAVVVTIKEYGVFVDIAPGVSGLIHISELANERVGDPNDYVSEGDDVRIKVMEVDNIGRLKLSAKAVASLKRKVGGNNNDNDYRSRGHQGRKPSGGGYRNDRKGRGNREKNYH